MRGAYRWLLRLAALGFGICFAYAGRFTMMGDGISYLDMGRMYLRGDWANALNPVWSPLYGILLACAGAVVRPSPAGLYPLFHCVGFLIYAIALWRFDALLRAILHHVSREHSSGELMLPEPWLWVLGYAIFLWCALSLVGVETTTPDMCVMAVVLTAAKQLLDIRIQGTAWGGFLRLGLICGVGFLCKTIMLPLAIIFVALAVLSVPGRWGRLVGALAAMMAFAGVAGPFIAGLSLVRGEFTVGDAGRLNYMWYVGYRTPSEPFYQNFRTTYKPHPAIHPPERATRLMLDTPAVYSFAGPVPGTYPPWYDPSYWVRNLSPQLDIEAQIKAVGRNGKRLARALWDPWGVFPLGLLLLFLFAKKRTSLREIRHLSLLIIPSVIGAVFYLPVLLHSRYVASFVLTGYLSLLLSLRFGSSARLRRMLPILASAITAACILGLGSDLAGKFAAEAAQEPLFRKIVRTNLSLKSYGVYPGDEVGSIGYRIYGAPLSGVRITATMLDDPSGKYWHADSATRGRVVAAFEAAGVRAVIAEDVPDDVRPDAGWLKLPGTDSWVYRFR